MAKGKFEMLLSAPFLHFAFLGKLFLTFFCVIASWAVTCIVISSCLPERGRDDDCLFSLWPFFTKSLLPVLLHAHFLELLSQRMVSIQDDLIQSEMPNYDLVLSFFLQWSTPEWWHFCIFLFFFSSSPSGSVTWLVFPWVLGFKAQGKGWYDFLFHVHRP